MAADKIRVGIIGANAHYGWSMRAHLPALRAMPDYELMAVCTSRPETAAESAAHYGARLAFHDYHAMVRHPDIDLVSVSVPVLLRGGFSGGRGPLDDTGASLGDSGTRQDRRCDRS